MDTVTYLTTALSQWKLLVAVVAGIVVLYWLVVLLQVGINRRYLKRRDMVWLEITPPATIAKTPEATEQLFSVIHGSRAARPLFERLLRRSPVMSFEIVSTRQDGIRYFLHLERYRSPSVQKTIASYIPDAKVKEVECEASEVDSVIEFTETSHFVLPITLTSAFAEHDPLAYVTGAMTKLQDDEQITLQLVAQPVKLREASLLSHKILGNENILQEVSDGKLSVFGKASSVLGKTASGMTDLTSEVYAGTTYGYKNYYDSKQRRTQQQVMATKRDRPARTLSAFELELMETMHRKVTRPLFQVNLRILVKSGAAKDHIAALKSALDGFSVPPYQSLKAKPQLPVLTTMRARSAVQRLPSLRRRSAIILSASELASLYHFPSSLVSKTDNLITSLSRTLPAPISMKNDQKKAIYLGENRHHGTTTPIGLTESERERHLYIIGGTGNGKTTMLLYSIVQDIQNDKGIAVIDPHGDLAETILKYVPEHRIRDVVYMNPDDLAHPIGMNLLELPEGLEGDDLIREKDLVTETTVSVMRKIFSEDDSGGHRIEYVLRNAIQTALTLENPTLFTIFELLNNAKFRRRVMNELTDENLKNFWKNEIGKAGDMQKVKMAAGITAKIGRFLFSGSAKRVLEQEKSTIDFEDILNSGKILICNFSKGLLGEDTSSLFGTTVLAKLQLASLRRARIAQQNRRPFYLYVDEFQNFATMGFVQMLSEARKYKLFLTMAEQSTSQQDQQRLVDIILANVGTVITFRSGSPADERYVLPLFAPFIDQGEIANLPAYSFYARVAAVDAQEPMSGVTLLLDTQGSSENAVRVVQYSRDTYGKMVEREESEEATDQPPQKAETKKTPTKKRAKKTTARAAKATSVGAEEL